MTAKWDGQRLGDVSHTPWESGNANSTSLRELTNRSGGVNLDGETSISESDIARVKHIVRMVAAAHVGGNEMIAHAETLKGLQSVVGDRDMVYAVTRHFAAVIAVLTQWLAHELGTASNIDAVAIIEDVLLDLEVSPRQ